MSDKVLEAVAVSRLVRVKETASAQYGSEMVAPRFASYRRAWGTLSVRILGLVQST